MVKILKFIRRFILSIMKIFHQFRNHYFNLIFPNIYFFATKRLNYKDYPICNQRVFFRGLGKINIGKCCILGYKPGGFHKGGSIELQPRYEKAIIQIGNNVATNNNIFICAANNIQIKDNTLIGQNVTIMDFEAHGIDPNKRNKVGDIGKVLIEENVWIGNNVIILKNSSIGKNSIVAAGAVVSGVFPDNVIIGGIPAKIIKHLK